MKRIIMFVLLFAAIKVAGQTTGYLRFDTVRIMKQNGTCELYIINKTKDSLGVLTNVGGGLTQFKRARAISDTSFIVGVDTIRIHSTGGGGGINPSDTTNKWINDIRRRAGTDTVEKFKNGTWQFGYKDSIGGGSGSGFKYIYSATAPTGADTSTIWIKTPTFCGVYDVYTYATYQFSWVRYGWLSIDGVFSTRPPKNVVLCGQSNAGGIGTGGDTAWVSGIIAYTTGAMNSGIDAPIYWDQARIGRSPFFLTNNNLGFQFAKLLKKHGDADIVRIIETYQGGTGLGAWLTGGAHYLLDTLRNRLARSGIDTIHAFLWHHGESGGVRGFSVGGYVLDQKDFYDTLCDPATVGFKRNYTPYIAGGLGGGDARTKSTLNNVGGAIAGQEMLNNDENLWTAWVPSWGLSDVGDGIHFSGTAIDSLAARYYSMWKQMPRSHYDETPQCNYDETYDTWKAYENRAVPYGGGGAPYRILLNSQAWKSPGGSYSYLTLDVPGGGIGVGNINGLPYAAAKELRVAGSGIISSGTHNLFLAGNLNIGGTKEYNTVLGNYSTSWALGSGFNNSVFAGYNAAYNTNRAPDNSVIIGSEAGLNHFPTGTGDYNTMTGRSSGANSGGRANAFYGAFSGATSSGEGISAFGVSAGAANNDSSMNNSTAIGVSAKWDRSNQVVLGDTNTMELRTGDFKWDINHNTTPTNGQYYAWNSTNSKFELTNPTGGTVTLQQAITNGSTLSSVNTIAAGNNIQTFTGTQSSSSNYAYNFQNTSGNGGALAASSVGSGSAFSASNSSTGLAGSFKVTPSSTNTVVDAIDFIRGTSGTAANGIGIRINFKTTTSAGNDFASSFIESKWTTATDGSEVGELSIWNRNTGSNYRRFTIKGTGQLELPFYGAGTFTGTPATTPVFTSTGDVVERVAPKIYTALVTQDGTTASPTVAVLGTNEIGSIVWTRNSTGNYTGTLSGAFTQNKTFFTVTASDETGNIFFAKANWVSTNTVGLFTKDSSGANADGFTNLSLRIEVYP